MPVKVRCPKCDRPLNAPDKSRGRAIRCPDCDAKVPVPNDGEGGGSRRPSRKRRPKKRSGDTLDLGDDFITGLDLRQKVDRSVRACANCGADLPEESDICPACEFDPSQGGRGSESQKKASRSGPDTSLFLSEAFGESLSFTFAHLGLVFKTFFFIAFYSTVATGCYVAYLMCEAFPPKIFWQFVTVVSTLIPLGWCWYLWRDIVKATMSKKKTVKRVKADIFEYAALGITVITWLIIFFSPTTAIFFPPGWFALYDSFLLGSILISLGFLLNFPAIPSCMPHLLMPVTNRAWNPIANWKYAFKAVKGSFTWAVVAGATILPILAGLIAIGSIYDAEIETFFDRANRIPPTVEEQMARVDEEMSNPPPVPGQRPPTAEDFFEITLPFNDVLVPIIVWYAVSPILAMVLVYNMRTSGWVAYYFRDKMELVTVPPEKKYKPGQKATFDWDKAFHGLLTCTLAAIWLVVGLYFGYLYFYPIYLFIAGVVGMLRGFAAKFEKKSVD